MCSIIFDEYEYTTSSIHMLSSVHNNTDSEWYCGMYVYLFHPYLPLNNPNHHQEVAHDGHSPLITSQSKKSVLIINNVKVCVWNIDTEYCMIECWLEEAICHYKWRVRVRTWLWIEVVRNSENQLCVIVDGEACPEWQTMSTHVPKSIQVGDCGFRGCVYYEGTPLSWKPLNRPECVPRIDGLNGVVVAERPSLIAHAFHTLEQVLAVEKVCSGSVELKDRRSPSRDIRVIHCHDMMGGYKQDYNVQGHYGANTFDESYNFCYWHLIDVFVYFAHSFVTVPPPQWIDAAHRNGVRVLGTVITEWEGGAAVLDMVLQSNELTESLIDRLVYVASAAKFDGWFVNIESCVSQEKVPSLVQFVKVLTERMHACVEGSMVIWYDSIEFETGRVKWQNVLNDANVPFFNVCDGLFTNYAWSEEDPRKSRVVAGESRALDVYTGVDCWGRGTYGGGGLSGLGVALTAISEAPTSVGLFAPAWTFEKFCLNGKKGRQHFEACERNFWDNNGGFIRDDHSPNLLKSDAWQVVSSGGQGFSDNMTTSFDWCIREQVVELSPDDSCTKLLVEQTFCGTPPDSRDWYVMSVELMDEAKVVLESFNTGECRLEDDTPLTIKHTFEKIPSDVRYIRWRDGGKDCEYWAGHYGTRVSGGELCLVYSSSSGSSDEENMQSVSSFTRARATPLGELPFVHNFNSGVGRKTFVNGRVVSERQWFNMSQQDPSGHWRCVRSGKTHTTRLWTVDWHYDVAFNGGSCVRVQSGGCSSSSTHTERPYSSYAQLFEFEEECCPKNVSFTVHKSSSPSVSLIIRSCDNKMYVLSERNVQHEGSYVCLSPCKVECFGDWNRMCFSLHDARTQCIVQSVGVYVDGSALVGQVQLWRDAYESYISVDNVSTTDLWPDGVLLTWNPPSCTTTTRTRVREYHIFVEKNKWCGVSLTTHFMLYGATVHQVRDIHVQAFAYTSDDV